MSFRTSTFASIVVACCMMVTSSEAQLVRQLGKLPFVGKVRQASFLGGGCDSCAAGPSCGLIGCDDPSCGCAAPSCGMAGSILGGFFGAGPGGCGASIEPSCGSGGLGYGGGFGLCGGGCDSCGDGGYLGRNLQRVTPCACGGSLIGDMARGLITLVDRAVGTTVATFFGGLQKMTCHASGTFAALQCAAVATCSSCGNVGCDGCGAGPVCGLDSTDCGCDISASCGAPACGVATEFAAPTNYPPAVSAPSYAPSYGEPSYAPAVDGGYSPPVAPAPAIEPLPSTPGEPAPISDPFLDDAVPMPQARAARTQATGFRVYESGPPSPPRMVHRNASRPAQQSTIRAASYGSPLQRRYLQTQGRTATLRR